MTGVKALFLAPIYGVALVVVTIIGFAVGPDIEEHIFPVITNQVVLDRWRTPDTACFRWAYHKARSATLDRVAFIVEREDGVRFPADEFRPDLGIGTNDSTTAKAGTTRIIPKCVTIPAALKKAERFTIKGRQLYIPWHRMWDLDQVVVDGGVLIDTAARKDAAEMVGRPDDP